MSLIFTDSFDHYATDDILKKWDTTNSGTHSIDGSFPRRVGTKYWKSTGTDAQTKNLSSFGPTIILGFAHWCTLIYEGVSFRFYSMSSDDGLKEVIELTISHTGAISVICGGTSVSSASALIFGSQWQYIEMKVFLHDTLGTVEVKISGTTVIDESGVDTRTNYNLEDLTLPICFSMQGAGSLTYIDDLYICDGDGGVNDDFLGDCRIDCLYPNAAGTNTTFTPLPAVDNYLNVDDPGDIDDDTTYNQSKTLNSIDSYNMESISALGTTIYGVVQNSCLRKTDADSRYAKDYLKTGAVETLGAELHLTDTYKVWQDLYDVNPEDSEAWAEADINALESGVKVTL
jgi:hypothetical protein